MKFSEVKAVRIPRGNVLAIKADGDVLWDNIRYRYVSLGDSISAGHTINEDWAKDYGEGSQYGVNGNTSTVIVPNCYVDLLRQDLRDRYGVVSVTSFSRSGDTVADLMEKLSHDVVRSTLKKADLVTICIGANDVLQPAFGDLNTYITTGSLENAESIIAQNLSNLENDNHATSYTALFNKLNEINPRAKYVFTTVYNPYKYLWCEEGQNGFFAPLLATIPDMSFFGFDVDGLIKDGLLATPIVQQFFSRVNSLSAWAETYVTALNNVLKSRIDAYAKSNFVVAETKALFDTYPDRTGTGDVKYNDLVNVEYTRGYNTMDMDWGQLYKESDAATYWTKLAFSYVSWSGFDISGFAMELMDDVINKVVVPDVDPHPETYGHYVLKMAFSDALG